VSSLKYVTLLTVFIAGFGLLPAAQVLCQERRIKPGDVIEIVVSGHEELSRSVLVNPEGKIDYPFLEGVPIDGLTLSRLRELLATQLSRSLEVRPFVTVRFAESNPLAVTVLGYVDRPGVYPLRGTSTRQSTNGETEGFMPHAQGAQIKLIRVEKPGDSEVMLRMSLLDVIALAGGATDQADLGRVKVIPLSGQNGRETRNIDVANLLQRQKPRSIPLVAPGDVVYVPKLNNVSGKLVTVLRDIATFATLYILIRSETR
jgi:protein involved in polysaccharide export with SLBB domain